MMPPSAPMMSSTFPLAQPADQPTAPPATSDTNPSTAQFVEFFITNEQCRHAPGAISEK